MKLFIHIIIIGGPVPKRHLKDTNINNVFFSKDFMEAKNCLKVRNINV